MIKILGFIIFTLFLISSCIGQTEQIKECTQDSDCAPDKCCHPSSCITIEDKPNCAGVFCTQECQPNTLDCGQGTCKCADNKCAAIFY